ncbi:hypothetical protein [Microvirga pudoricolor]|uniref:hypothetical protein n=1 Tax=Microvirga pudoricolor TaxID=2778729 RepID=UPI00194DD4BB|nr:hypothetical protein [Microvirga pudoricolor]MBM6596212.1 hypothetical protein [Microvirga pudoricolor]
MLVTADEVNRSFKGTVDLLHARAEGLKSFDFSETGFWHSFSAIGLTLPAYIVTLALERHRLGILQPDNPLLGSLWLDGLVALGFAAGFLALPLAMIGITRGLRLTHRYVPFVIVTNWIAVVGLLTLAFPGLLMLIGWAPPSLAGFFTLAFAALLLRMQWFATKATLGVSGGLAFAIVLLGLGLNAAIAGAMRALIG